MRGGRAFIGQQEKAVIREYEHAVRLGAAGRAYAIWTANQDLIGEFEKVNKDLAKERATQVADIEAQQVAGVR